MSTEQHLEIGERRRSQLYRELSITCDCCGNPCVDLRVDHLGSRCIVCVSAAWADEGRTHSSNLDSITKALGSPDWEYPGQVVRDVQDTVRRMMRATLDNLVSMETVAAILGIDEETARKLRHTVYTPKPDGTTP